MRRSLNDMSWPPSNNQRPDCIGDDRGSAVMIAGEPPQPLVDVDAQVCVGREGH
jgi:hypothetical protein